MTISSGQYDNLKTNLNTVIAKLKTETTPAEPGKALSATQEKQLIQLDHLEDFKSFIDTTLFKSLDSSQKAAMSILDLSSPTSVSQKTLFEVAKAFNTSEPSTANALAQEWGVSPMCQVILAMAEAASIMTKANFKLAGTIAVKGFEAEFNLADAIGECIISAAHKQFGESLIKAGFAAIAGTVQVGFMVTSLRKQVKFEKREQMQKDAKPEASIGYADENSVNSSKSLKDTETEYNASLDEQRSLKQEVDIKEVAARGKEPNSQEQKDLVASKKRLAERTTTTEKLEGEYKSQLETFNKTNDSEIITQELAISKTEGDIASRKTLEEVNKKIKFARTRARTGVLSSAERRTLDANDAKIKELDPKGELDQDLLKQKASLAKMKVNGAEGKLQQAQLDQRTAQGNVNKAQEEFTTAHKENETAQKEAAAAPTDTEKKAAATTAKGKLDAAQEKLDAAKNDLDNKNTEVTKCRGQLDQAQTLSNEAGRAFTDKEVVISERGLDTAEGKLKAAKKHLAQIEKNGLASQLADAKKAVADAEKEVGSCSARLKKSYGQRKNFQKEEGWRTKMMRDPQQAMAIGQALSGLINAAGNALADGWLGVDKAKQQKIQQLLQAASQILEKVMGQLQQQYGKTADIVEKFASMIAQIAQTQAQMAQAILKAGGN